MYRPRFEPMRRALTCLLLLGCALSLCWCRGPARAAESGPAGHWEGSVQGPNVLIQLQADLRQGAAGIDGSMDIPQQGASKLPLRALRFEGGRAHFELSTGAAPGIFDGVFAGDSMSGSYTQGPFQGTFRLVRTGAAAPLPPAEPVPYREEEVTFHDGEVALAGTLTLPPGPGRHPAVVMVTGSGPQNRDEEIFSFKPFRLIADHLTRHGIAVLRYDDRGVGKSTGDFSAATTADFADDARAAVRYLMGRAEVDTAHIGVCGHSEGGLIAPMVANRGPHVAFIVLLGGPGLPGDSILLEQGQLILRASGAPPEQQAAEADMQRMVFRAARGSGSWDSVRTAMLAQGRLQVARLPEEQRQAMGDPEKYLEQAIGPQLKFSQSAWMRYFLDHDPAPELERVRCPVLAVYGEKDLQVPAEPNRRALAAALAKGGNPDVTVRMLPRANHLFLGSDTGAPSEYPTMKKEFVPGFLELLSGWINARCAR